MAQNRKKKHPHHISNIKRYNNFSVEHGAVPHPILCSTYSWRSVTIGPTTSAVFRTRPGTKRCRVFFKVRLGVYKFNLYISQTKLMIGSALWMLTNVIPLLQIPSSLHQGSCQWIPRLLQVSVGSFRSENFSTKENDQVIIV